MGTNYNRFKMEENTLITPEAINEGHHLGLFSGAAP